MKKRGLIILMVIFVAILAYGIKCEEGIDLFKKFSFGVYRGRHFQVTGSPRLALAQQPLEKMTEIAVRFAQEKGPVNRKIFGNNFLGHGGLKSADYGYGLWDPKWDHAPVRVAVDLAKGIGITVARFPGGCGTHIYDWKKAVGKNRKEYLFGIDEFLKTAEAIGAQAVFTVSYFTGDEQDAAGLVRYTKGRARYFEIGNEVWHGDHRDIKTVAPREYAERYLKYYAAMKEVDPSIQIGAVLKDPPWNAVVLDVIRDKIDFGILHFYPAPAGGKALEKMEPEYIFAASLAVPVIQYGQDIQAALLLLREKAGRDIPLAITEFNGGFVQENPVPYRHTLGNALVNAELLRVFMRPENNILMASHWNFVNEYWGMIANGFNGKYETLNNPYYKRPNYDVFAMYHDHFGDVLIEADVQSDSYDVAEYPAFSKTLVGRIKEGRAEGPNLAKGDWKIDDFPGTAAFDQGGVLTLEFKAPEQFNYYHSVKRAPVAPDTYYRLSGYIKADGLVDQDDNGVCLEVQDGRGWAKTRSAMATQKVKGTTDWQYVETIYKTLPDADAAVLIARRVGESGPLKGKAYFKDVKFEKFIPEIDTKIPYLSVNASKSEDGNKVYLMVVNKNLEAPLTATIELKDFTPASAGDAWVLNGPAVDATNEKKHDNVKVTEKVFEIKGNPFEFTFEPHSLTALVIERRRSDND